MLPLIIYLFFWESCFLLFKWIKFSYCLKSRPTEHKKVSKTFLRAHYQIPDYIPIRLPYKSEKCYYERVLKAGLRFPPSTLYRELLKYLGLSISQISPNAWRVFIAMEVLYGAMSNGVRVLTVREFLHCYHPDEIDKSRGMHSFVLRKFVLKVIFETPDSNRDWKSRYFFLEGDGWMCHLGETEHMPVDKTWGILNPSGIHPSYNIWRLSLFETLQCFWRLSSFLQSDGAHKLISRSLTSLREFLPNPSQRNEPGPNSSILTPSTGIVMGPNLLKQQLNTKSELDNVSPSFPFVYIVCVYL